ncbi:ClpP class periplasmic serine protease [Thioflavicoccus mobilis 8321]|uniref:ClpP class periplasmic serine protease n=1 Tax=Thioflavicoccus mobilis 8321 TaxID=765912 RepID=L0GTR7_9GAMM|nr:S49 family peptidase [Thioflavicoccus mobilis]AGA89386.1 ClpP class periplasmic serine protease [Thioflavicoccus mobilis 8321]
MNWKFWKRRRESLVDPQDPQWERTLMGRIASDYVRERRQRRRWGNLFKLLLIGYLFAVLIAFYAEDLAERVGGEGHTSLVKVDGVIGADAEASADRVVGSLRKAFEDEATKGVILRINSPGGSPVQAGYINDEVHRLKEKYREEHDEEMPVYAVAMDLCASGGYYVAVAADEIYVDKASLVGSIGVRIDSFGLDKVLEDLDIERRLMTAGENKGILDPFSPMSEAQRQYIQGVLDQLHGQFIAAVKAGRGDRLQGGDELFSGLFWTGEQAVELGLADGLGSASYVARELIGAETIVDYTQEWDLIERLSRRMGTTAASALKGMIEVLDLPAMR